MKKEHELPNGDLIEVLKGVWGITEAHMLAMPTCDELGRIPDASLGMRRP